ncbi:hypothetical protein [Micromonospora endolithica]|uniref:Uncharacterized protein n=1 Tax=Micromonospora endolithica TaxID=230091 RepID=A0A3A9YYB4_9ACTN|nr:hypothetical protein [Micromonospora endolithica]RKN40674.1 hypothetical protein D7223_26455 [Micromonospora endolithica]TWJ21766.1 hypothetical protein JD76_01877 [Micromonospora endolithica]
MIFRRAGRPHDRDAADRLLDAAGSTPVDPGADPLTHLLAAANAPARPTELAGEQAALAAFRAARAGTSVPDAPAPRGRRRFTAGAVAWAAGVAVTATAGAAVAAVALDRAGDPEPPRRPATTSPAGTPAESTPTRPTRTGTVPPTGTALPTGTRSAEAPSTPAVAPSTPEDRRTVTAPSHKLAGSCKAYLAKSPAQRAKALEKPGFADLAAAVDDPARAEDFCRQLLGDDDRSDVDGDADEGEGDADEGDAD